MHKNKNPILCILTVDKTIHPCYNTDRKRERNKERRNTTIYEVGIWTPRKGWQSWHVEGCEAAYEAYRKACELCELVGAENAAIWDAVTFEVLADLAGEAED